MDIRALQERDERSLFRSGGDDLDRFLRKFAGQNQFRHHVGVTYVATQDERILGYATVSPAHIEIDGLPVGQRKKLPRYPLPVLRLARLAVDVTAQGQGVGTALLRFVLNLAMRMTDDYGCVGVLVDAKPDAMEFYARHGFVPTHAVVGQSDARPAPTPMFLAIKAIADAIGRA
jgi:GNAT superfamily N-acetyltransferase